MTDWLKDKQGKLYKWAMIALIVVSGACVVATQASCAFLRSAVESAEQTKQDLNGVNERIARVLEKLQESKEQYESTMADIAKAQEAGELDKVEALQERAKVLLDAGNELWKTLEQEKDTAEQLGRAFDSAVARVEKAGSLEEQAGSIFGTILQGALSLLGVGGLGGAAAAAIGKNNAKQQADAYKADAESYRAAAVATSKLLEKTKELAPDAWGSIDKASILPPIGSPARNAMDEVRPARTSTAVSVRASIATNESMN